MSACNSCQKPLTLFIEDEEQDFQGGSSSATPAGTTVPDDVELNCGCHFHWQCLLDIYQITNCPNCQRDITTVTEHETQILCNVRNEGGEQTGLDIFPTLQEELYLKTYPEERVSRAFLEFCKEGDIEAIVDLLKANEEDEPDAEDGDDEMDVAKPPTVSSILRYQDPMNRMRSALHFAVGNGKVEVVWLLLLLASTLPPSDFPPDVLQAAQTLDITRDDQEGKTDIRSLWDEDGKIALTYAEEFFASQINVGVLENP